ncbi:MAG: GIY-YIG nuclease family protein [Planctomycetes bacterium]|nr:GIY-YIG nuclease family protein [Planctomycetota bacterium]
MPPLLLGFIVVLSPWFIFFLICHIAKQRKEQEKEEREFREKADRESFEAKMRNSFNILKNLDVILLNDGKIQEYTNRYDCEKHCPKEMVPFLFKENVWGCVKFDGDGVTRVAKFILEVMEMRYDFYSQFFDYIGRSEEAKTYYIGRDKLLEQAVIKALKNNQAYIIDDDVDFRPTNSDMVAVYVLKSGSSIKVGISVTVKKRIGQLQTGSAQKIKYVRGYWFDDRDKASAVESAVHKTLKSKRLKGEWFAVDGKTACAAIEKETLRLFDEAINQTLDGPFDKWKLVRHEVWQTEVSGQEYVVKKTFKGRWGKWYVYMPDGGNSIAFESPVEAMEEVKMFDKALTKNLPFKSIFK